MNIHLPAILMFTRGTRFWHTAIWGWHEFLGVVWCCLKIWKPNPLVKIIILRSKMTYAPQRAESTSGSPSKRFHSGALGALGALEEWSLACEIGWSKNLHSDGTFQLKPWQAKSKDFRRPIATRFVLNWTLLAAWAKICSAKAIRWSFFQHHPSNLASEAFNCFFEKKTHLNLVPNPVGYHTKIANCDRNPSWRYSSGP